MKKYKYDIFLSYNIDDFDEFDSKWLNDFKKNLIFFLSQYLNREVEIIDSISYQTISENVLSDTLIFIPIITENYSENENNYHELNSFLNHVPELEFNHKSRVIKVLLGQGVNQPEKIKDLLSYKFYEFDQRSGNIMRYQLDGDTRTAEKYSLKLMDIVSDASTLLNVDVQDDSKGVYLALSTPDQSANRDVISRELERLGFVVYPDHELNFNNLEADILDYLGRSKMAIHILGDQYGEEVNDQGESIVALQNRIASFYAQKNKKFDRLIWQPLMSSIIDEDQAIFFDKLIYEKDLFYGAEMIKTPLENLKAIIQNRIERKNIKRSKIDDHSVYLITDVEDEQYAEDLVSKLKLEGFHAFAPNFKGDQHKIMEKHRHALAHCEIPVVYYKHENEYWLKMKLLELSKAPGFGRKTPIETKLIFNDSGVSIKDLGILNNAKIISDESELMSTLSKMIINN